MSTFIHDVKNIKTLLISFKKNRDIEYKKYMDYIWENSDKYWYEYFKSNYTDTWTIKNSDTYQEIINSLIHMSDDDKNKFPNLIIKDNGIPTRKQTSGIVKSITNNNLDILSKFINIPKKDISEMWHYVESFLQLNQMTFN